MRGKHEKKGRKFLLIISLIAIVLVGGILAYFTDIEVVPNNIKTGYVDIDLKEYKDTNDNDWEDVTGVLPGSDVTKIAKISKKEGSADCYIRAKIEYSGDVAASTDITDSILDIDTTKWTKATDGYYYYSDELTTTNPVTLFTKVTIPGKLDNTYANKSLTITVTAEAIQSENFTNTAPWKDGANAVVILDYEI